MIFLIIIIILNLLYTSFLNNSEHISISYNSWLYNLGMILLIITIYYIANITNKILYKKVFLIDEKHLE